MNTKITTANYEVIDSGLVTSFNGEPISISMDASSDNPLKINFVFLKNEEIKESLVDAETVNEREMTFRLTNFNNPLGTGIIKPLEIANNDEGNKLYINFQVYTVGASAPTLHYTIYIGM